MGTQSGFGMLYLKYSIALAQIFLCHFGQVTCVRRTSIYHLQIGDNVLFFNFPCHLPIIMESPQQFLELGARTADELMGLMALCISKCLHEYRGECFSLSLPLATGRCRIAFEAKARQYHHVDGIWATAIS